MSNHRPVLLKEVLRYLQPKHGESYLDVTAGYGGHTEAVLAKTDSPLKAVLFDRDAEAIQALKAGFAKHAVKIIHQDFLTASRDLASDRRRFDMILADLGVSSAHFDSGERGFSITHPGPLDMRMDQRQKLTAADIVNSASEAELRRIFIQYGEEPKADRIAKQIVRQRPITNTAQLAAIAAKSASRRTGRRSIHPATRIFQSLRIAVNDELNQLEQSLPIWLELLTPGGRLAVISFHSLEDRIVKQFLAEHSVENYEGELRILTKKPIAASIDEIVSNPRARSAKLRAAAKINI